MHRMFMDRYDAGRRLAGLLAHYSGRTDLLVFALPRGGVPVGFEIARLLRAPLDVFVVRKLGVPGQEELALGAIASGGHRVLNDRLVGVLGLPEEAIEDITAREQHELKRRERLYRGDRSPPSVRGKTVVLVDDGLATGSTMCVAARALRRAGPAQLVIAVPVAAESTLNWIRDEADEVVACLTPRDFVAVGEWYRDFSQTSDEEVIDLLDRASLFLKTG